MRARRTEDHGGTLRHEGIKSGDLLQAFDPGDDCAMVFFGDAPDRPVLLVVGVRVQEVPQHRMENRRVSGPGLDCVVLIVARLDHPRLEGRYEQRRHVGVLGVGRQRGVD
ncbi:hypothetical protein [Actinoplanes philippinensis]|uniref:hypothetical protein n=1 Tax=Actinoplanes philippinensis TaxID=35752 RepID=UPI0033CB57FC